MVTKGAGQGGRFQSVCFPLLNWTVTVPVHRTASKPRSGCRPVAHLRSASVPVRWMGVRQGESFRLRKCMTFTGSGTYVSQCISSLTVSLPLSYSCKQSTGSTTEGTWNQQSRFKTHCSIDFAFVTRRSWPRTYVQDKLGRCGQWHNSQMEINMLLSRREVIHNFFYTLLLNFGCAGLCCCPGDFSVLAARGGHLQLWCEGFSLWWLLLLCSMGCRVHGLQ